LAQYIAREEYPNEDKEEVKIYKLILDDCAMKDADFAAILRAISKQNVIKSIEYANNEFGKESLAALTEILRKRYPSHTLESLTLGYLNTNEKLMYQLLFIMDEEPNLKRICLRGLPLNLENTRKDRYVINQLSVNSHLMELDLSGSKLTATYLRDLAEALASNPLDKEIDTLNLSYINMLDGSIDPKRRIYQVTNFWPNDIKGYRRKRLITEEH